MFTYQRNAIAVHVSLVLYRAIPSSNEYFMSMEGGIIAVVREIPQTS